MSSVSGILFACGGFLLAVLWMDLMFDVQVLRYRRDAELPEAVLASIANYYRRVTTEASPMNRLIAAVMVIGLVAIVAQIIAGHEPVWVGLLSLLFAGGPIALAIARVVPNAIRLGSRVDTRAEQAALARSICRDHLLCCAGIVAFVFVQLS